MLNTDRSHCALAPYPLTSLQEPTMLIHILLFAATTTFLASAQQDCIPFPQSQVPPNAYTYDCESISINATCVLACVSDMFMPQGDPTFVCTDAGWVDSGAFSCLRMIAAA